MIVAAGRLIRVVESWSNSAVVLPMSGEERLEKDYQLALAGKLRSSGLFVGVEIRMGAAGRADLVVQGAEDSEVAIVEVKVDAAHVGIGQLFYYAGACEARAHLVLAVPYALADKRIRAACAAAGVRLWSLFAKGADGPKPPRRDPAPPFLDLLQAVEDRAAEDLNGAFWTTAELMEFFALTREQVHQLCEQRRFRTVRVGMGGLLVAKHDIEAFLLEGRQKNERARSHSGRDRAEARAASEDGSTLVRGRQDPV